MTDPRCRGGAGLLQIEERIQREAEISERVQREHDPEPGHVRRSGGGGPDQEATRVKGKPKRQKVTKMAGLYMELQLAEGQPSP